MGCDCKWAETVLSLIILVFALWPNILSPVLSKWLVVASAVILLVHSLSCKNLSSCKPMKSEKVPMVQKAKKPIKKKR